MIQKKSSIFFKGKCQNMLVTIIITFIVRFKKKLISHLKVNKLKSNQVKIKKLKNI